MLDAQLNLVESPDEAAAFLRWLGERRRVMGVDIETTGLNLGRDRIRTVQFGDTRTGWTIPIDEWRGLIRYTLAEYEGPIVGHNFKFDASFLQRDGMNIPWDRTHDTMAMAFLNNSLGPRSLKIAAAIYIDPELRTAGNELKDVMKRNKWDWSTVPVTNPIYWGYAASDPVLTARLAEILWPRIQYARSAYDTEIACARVVSQLERRGVLIDVEYCQEQIAALRDELWDIRDRLPFPPSVPAKVIEALQGEGVTLTKRTRKGQLAVDEDVLQTLIERGNETARLVLRARKIQKLITSFFQNFVDYAIGNRVFPSIHQLQAQTGRMSMTEPALQTLPRSKQVRRAFVPEEGTKMVLVDYQNEELRIAAHYCQDKLMLQLLSEGVDLHGETAKEAFGENYTPKQRSQSKNGMFSYAYGAGVPVFAKTIKAPQEVAARIFSALGVRYPGLRKGMADTTREVRETAAGTEYGYITLSDGRRLRVPTQRAYKGFNFKVQGECAVILKRATVDLDAAGLGNYMRLLVHDEVVFNIPTKEVKDVVPVIEQVMTRDDYRVLLGVDSTVVDDWGQKYE